MAVLALVIGEGSRRGRYLRRVSLVQIESKCDRRVNPAAMPRLRFATTAFAADRRHNHVLHGRGKVGKGLRRVALASAAARRFSALAAKWRGDHPTGRA